MPLWETESIPEGQPLSWRETEFITGDNSLTDLAPGVLQYLVSASFTRGLLLIPTCLQIGCMSPLWGPVVVVALTSTPRLQMVAAGTACLSGGDPGGSFALDHHVLIECLRDGGFGGLPEGAQTVFVEGLFPSEIVEEYHQGLKHALLCREKGSSSRKEFIAGRDQTNKLMTQCWRSVYQQNVDYNFQLIEDDATREACGLAPALKKRDRSGLPSMAAVASRRRPRPAVGAKPVGGPDIRSVAVPSVAANSTGGAGGDSAGEGEEEEEEEGGVADMDESSSHDKVGITPSSPWSSQ